MKKVFCLYLQFCKILTTITLYMSCLALFLMFLIINYDMFVRNIFNNPGVSAVEITGYILVFIVFASVSYTFMNGGFIRVDMLYSRMKPHIKKYVDLVNYTFATVFIGLLTRSSWVLILYSWKTQQRSNGLTQWLLFWPRLIIGIGIVILLLNLIGLLIKQILIVLKKFPEDWEINLETGNSDSNVVEGI